MQETEIWFHVEAQNFWIINCHQYDPLLYLVVNVIPELEMHEDTLSPNWMVECAVIRCLGGLAI